MLTLTGIVLGTPDPQALASFYEELLGYERTTDSPEWVVTTPPGGGPGLSFQREEYHSPATWPAGPTDQQMQVHLDIAVDDLDTAGKQAEAAGVRHSGRQACRKAAGKPHCACRHEEPSGSAPTPRT